VTSSPAEEGKLPSRLVRLRDRDHTRGHLLVSIAALSVPAVLTSAIGLGLFQIVDLHFLGELGDVEVAAAGATNHTLRQFFMMLFMGLGVGAQMMIAQCVGRRDTEAADHVAGQVFLAATAVALVGGFGGLVFPEALISLVARDPDVIAAGTTYLRITFLTLVVMAAMQMFTAILTGAGDTTTPLIITFIVTPLAILAEWAFAFGHLGLPALGIAGMALGTAAGSAGGVGVAVWALFSGRCRVHLRGAHFAPDGAALRRLVGVSWQPALHMLARSLMLVFFMWLAGKLGARVQAAYTIGLRIEMVAVLVIFPIANACATLVGQNLGARDLGRAWRSVHVSFAIATAAMWPVCLALFRYRAPIVGFFTDDPEVAAIAAEFVAFSSVILAFYGLYFVSYRTLQASGDMISPMLISIGTAVILGAPTGYFLAMGADFGARGMWIANLVNATANTLLMTGWLMTGHWARAHAAAEGA